MEHLRYAHLSEPELQTIFLDIIRETPFLTTALTQARALNLPNWQIVSGALYNTVWNHLTNRPATTGINDIDLMYLDPDTSWQAENEIIQTAIPKFAPTPPAEIRNQSRVHLWYEQHFGQSIPPITSVNEAITLFASKTHSVGIHLDQNDHLTLFAPYGLSDIFNFRVTPNPIRDNRETHGRKAKRALTVWPELTIIPWP